MKKRVGKSLWPTPRCLAIFLAGLFALTALPAEPCEAADSPTLAVLNFTNRNPGDGWDWLGKGLADMLITDISVSDQIQLVTREDMQALFDEMRLGATGAVSADSAQQFGQTMRVEFVLTGTYGQDKGALTIEAHAVNVADQKVRRVEVVTGHAADALKLEKDLALNIVKNFNLPLTEAERALLLRMPTQNIDASRAFYGAVNAWDNGQACDAVGLGREALKADSMFDRARLEVARMYRSLLEFEHADVELCRLVELQEDSPFADDALFAHAKLVEKFLAGSQDDAIAAYDAVAEAYPKGDMALFSRFRAGMIAYQRGDPTQSITLLRGLSKCQVHTYAPGWNWCKTTAELCIEGLQAELGQDERLRVEEVSLVDEPTQTHRFTLFPPKSSETLLLVNLKAPPERHIISVGFEFEIKGWGCVLDAKVLEADGRLAWGGAAPYRKEESIVPISVPRRNVQVRVSRTTKEVLVEAMRLTVRLEPGKEVQRPHPLAGMRLTGSRNLPKQHMYEDMNLPALTDPALNIASLPEAEGGVFYPCMTQDQSGRYWLAYNDQCSSRQNAPTGGDADLWLTSSTDGKDWTEPCRLPVNSDYHDLHPWLLVDNEHRLRLYWSSQRKGYKTYEVMTSSSRDGVAWATPRVCRLVHQDSTKQPSRKRLRQEWVLGNYCPRVIQRRDGRFQMVYLSFAGDPGSIGRDQGIPSFADSEDGITWYNCRQVYYTRVSGPLSLMANEQRNILRLIGETGGGQVWGACSDDDGHTWKAQRAGDNITGSLSWPQAQFDPDGNILMVFGWANKGIHLTRSRDGVRWEDTTQIGFPGANPGSLFLFFDDRNKGWLVLGSYSEAIRNRSVHVMPLPSLKP